MRYDLPCGTTVHGHNGSIPGFSTVVLSTTSSDHQLVLSVNTDWTAAIEQAANTLAVAHFCRSS